MRTKNQSRVSLMPVVLLTVLSLVTIAVGAVEFNRLVPIPGGASAQRLSVSLGAAGYVGGSALDELTICIPSSNLNTMYLGSVPGVNNTTGFPLGPGDCITYRAAGRPIEASSIYVYVSTTENAAISLRAR